MNSIRHHTDKSLQCKKRVTKWTNALRVKSANYEGKVGGELNIKTIKLPVQLFKINLKRLDAIKINKCQSTETIIIPRVALINIGSKF